MKSLLEIEEAIAKLPAKARRQLVQDIPALCPGEFPADGWDAILNDAAPRPALASVLDKLDAGRMKNLTGTFRNRNLDAARKKFPPRFLQGW